MPGWQFNFTDTIGPTSGQGAPLSIDDIDTTITLTSDSGASNYWSFGVGTGSLTSLGPGSTTLVSIAGTPTFSANSVTTSGAAQQDGLASATADAVTQTQTGVFHYRNPNSLGKTGIVLMGTQGQTITQGGSGVMLFWNGVNPQVRYILWGYATPGGGPLATDLGFVDNVTDFFVALATDSSGATLFIGKKDGNHTILNLTGTKTLTTVGATYGWGNCFYVNGSPYAQPVEVVSGELFPTRLTTSQLSMVYIREYIKCKKRGRNIR